MRFRIRAPHFVQLDLFLGAQLDPDLFRNGSGDLILKGQGIP